MSASSTTVTNSQRDPHGIDVSRVAAQPAADPVAHHGHRHPHRHRPRLRSTHLGADGATTSARRGTRVVARRLGAPVHPGRRDDRRCPGGIPDRPPSELCGGRLHDAADDPLGVPPGCGVAVSRPGRHHLRPGRHPRCRPAPALRRRGPGGSRRHHHRSPGAYLRHHLADLRAVVHLRRHREMAGGRRGGHQVAAAAQGVRQFEPGLASGGSRCVGPGRTSLLVQSGGGMSTQEPQEGSVS